MVADGAATKSSRICGLSRKAFIIVACIVAVVIIAAAVGGGVGGSLAGKKSTSNTPAGGSTGLVTVFDMEMCVLTTIKAVLAPAQLHHCTPPPHLPHELHPQQLNAHQQRQ